MLDHVPHGFKRRRGRLDEWANERTFHQSDRYWHESGATLRGNCEARSIDFSASRLAHGMNCYATDEQDLLTAWSRAQWIVDEVIEGAEMGNIISLEAFVHLPIPFPKFRRLFRNKRNRMFKVQHQHVEPHGWYLFNHEWHRFNPRYVFDEMKGREIRIPDGTTRATCAYDKAAEHRRKGYPVGDLDGSTRFEVRLHNPILSKALREFDTLTLANLLLPQVYKVVRDHALGFEGSEILQQWLPVSYDEFISKSKSRSRKLC